MKLTDIERDSRSKMRKAISLILIYGINGALLWTILNYKSMPIAYTINGSWGAVSIRAPWGKAQDHQADLRPNRSDQATTLAAQPSASSHTPYFAPPVKLDSHGNPERGSSYRTYRCIVNGYPMFLDSPCENPQSPQKSHQSDVSD